MTGTKPCLALELRFPPRLAEPVRGALFLAGVDSFEELLQAGSPASPQAIFKCYPRDAAQAEHIRQTVCSVLAAERELLHFQALQLEKEDWSSRWQSYWQPVAIGKALFISPSWLDAKPPEDRLLIRLNPGLAFGTGAHATTILCLELIEECLAERMPQSFLDVGCGSGVLTIAAGVLGAEPLVAVDIEEQARAATRESSILNGLSEKVAVHAALEEVEGEFDLVCANILSATLNALWRKLVARLAPEGKLVISGVLVEEVAQFVERPGLRLLGVRERDEWAALIYCCSCN